MWAVVIKVFWWLFRFLGPFLLIGGSLWGVGVYLEVPDKIDFVLGYLFGAIPYFSEKTAIFTGLIHDKFSALMEFVTSTSFGQAFIYVTGLDYFFEYLLTLADGLIYFLVYIVCGWGSTLLSVVLVILGIRYARKVLKAAAAGAYDKGSA